MKLGLDASRATLSKRRGSEDYSFHLIKALAKIDKKNKYLLYSPRPPQDELANLPPNFEWKIMPFPRFWTQVRLSWQMLKEPVDLLFVPSHVIPIIHPQKTVLTIHDLGYKYFPKAYSFFARFYENFALRFLVKSVAKIIVPSTATKQDLIKFTGLDADRISVVYHGFDKKLYKPGKKITSAFPYLLFLGRLEQKKNLIGLIKAFQKLKTQSLKLKAYKLVLIGQPGFGYQRIKEVIGKLSPDIKRDVLKMGHLSDKEVASWMRGAEVFVFPSFLEGFGIPVIEAMATGVPVVASNIPALAETSGKAALLVNPESPEEIAFAIKKVIFDQKLQKELIVKGLKRAKEFSWQKCAKETLAVLEEVRERS